jgi:hypothetical protein
VRVGATQPKGWKSLYYLAIRPQRRAKADSTTELRSARLGDYGLLIPILKPDQVRGAESNFAAMQLCRLGVIFARNDAAATTKLATGSVSKQTPIPASDVPLVRHRRLIRLNVGAEHSPATRRRHGDRTGI